MATFVVLKRIVRLTFEIHWPLSLFGDCWLSYKSLRRSKFIVIVGLNFELDRGKFYGDFSFGLRSRSLF